MAFNANTAWEVRVTGDDTNGGAFNLLALSTGTTDYSRSDAPAVSVTDAVTNGTTTITSASANFPSDCLGNGICISGGTGGIVQRWAQILSRTNANTIVVDSATGLTTGTGATLKVGGAVASPGGAWNAHLVSGNYVFIKYNATPFLITSTAQNAPGGRMAPINGVAYCGYDTARTLRNFDANRPTIKLDSSLSTTNIISSTSSALIESLILDGNNITSGTGCTHRGSVWRCRFQGFTAGTATDGAATGISEAVLCEFTGNSGVAACTYYNARWCVAWNNSFTPFAVVATCESCLSFNNTGATTDGFSASRKFYNCVSYNNARNGFAISNANESAATNCIAELNGAFGFSGNSSQPMLVNCADYANTVNRVNSCRDVYPIILTSSPFVNAAGGVFDLNNVTGAGALLRALAIPAALPNGAGVNYRDVGALQHPGGGSVGGPVRVLAPNTWQFVG